MSPDDAIALFWQEYNLLNEGTKPDRAIGEWVVSLWDILSQLLLAEDPEQRVRSRAEFEYHRQFVDRQTLPWRAGNPPRLIVELMGDYHEVLFQCCPLQCDLREIWEQLEDHGLPFKYNAMRSIAEELDALVQHPSVGEPVPTITTTEIRRLVLCILRKSNPDEKLPERTVRNWTKQQGFPQSIGGTRSKLYPRAEAIAWIRKNHGFDLE